MLEMKRMNLLQQEYKTIILKYQNAITTGNISSAEIKKMFDDIHLLWIKNNPYIQYFLSNISINDNISFLAGAIHVDVTNNGHTEMAFSGQKTIINDPVSKMSIYFEQDTGLQEKMMPFFQAVMMDIVKVLSDYDVDYIILPLDSVRDKDRDNQMGELRTIADQCILQMFEDDNITVEIIQGLSFEEIETKIPQAILTGLLYSSVNDMHLPLRDRVERNIGEGLGFDVIGDSTDGEKFILATSQFIMQCFDVFSVSASYNITPFIRNPILMNYMLLLYEGVKMIASDELINRCLICFYTQQLIEQEALNYTFLRSNYGHNNFVGKAYKMLMKKHMTFPNANPDVLRNEITAFFKDFRRSLPF